MKKIEEKKEKFVSIFRTCRSSHFHRHSTELNFDHDRSLWLRNRREIIYTCNRKRSNLRVYFPFEQKKKKNDDVFGRTSRRVVEHFRLAQQ